LTVCFFSSSLFGGLFVLSPNLDFNALEKSCRYEGGYSASHPMVRSLWEFLHSLPEDKKKQFLFFCTGSDRAPVRGLGCLPHGFTIGRNGPDSDRLNFETQFF
jgi:ubiquitin-protein ligase E3 A